MSYRKAVLEQLERNGYRKLSTKRGNGSHEAWQRGSHTQIVPRHVDDRHFANDLMKQAGIQHRFK